jgi:hypothetical protein
MTSLAFEYPEMAAKDWDERNAVYHPSRWGANRAYTLYQRTPLPWPTSATPPSGVVVGALELGMSTKSSGASGENRCGVPLPPPLMGR